MVQDTAFWQKNFSSRTDATVPGYNIAAIAVFGIPFGLGTVIGLTARALHNTPIFPTYPGSLTAEDVSTGMVMPLVLKALIGTKGLIGFFFLLFMALTSTISSSMIAVSSILSYDVYKTYLNPRVTDRQLVRVSHITVIIHGIFVTGISIALNYGNANMTWIGKTFSALDSSHRYLTMRSLRLPSSYHLLPRHYSPDLDTLLVSPNAPSSYTISHTRLLLRPRSLARHYEIYVRFDLYNNYKQRVSGFVRCCRILLFSCYLLRCYLAL